MRILYRVRQFWLALTAAPGPADWQEIQAFLAPALLELFTRLEPGEQAHSLNVFRQLVRQGEQDTDLWVAALLHDVGKTRCRLRLWERVAIVAGKTLAPDRAKAWGAFPEPVEGWRRPFVVAEQHAAWGAQLAAAAGASALAVELIGRHQDPPQAGAAQTGPDRLLQLLQRYDNES